ncbi:MAG: hypothetical protein BMS9Abin14_573 [Gammaproteobacteria bacterium]|nr:MAG: hypothetical protein BMS9Abin14_573 [Gammaproteobacteria bacterium]
MSKFIDSPFEVCPVCDQYVFLDQSYRQCAREHHCGNMKCPLERFFVGTEVQIPADQAAQRAGTEKQWAGNH